MDTTVPRGSVGGTIQPPCSKSYAQRALAVSLLAEGQSTLRNITFCDDTRSAISCIEALGARVHAADSTTLVVHGGLRPRDTTLDVGSSGLATRLFTPIASLCSQPMLIAGSGSLLLRPMTMMIEPLRSLGVQVKDGGGYLPIEVCGPMRGGEIEVDGSVSSQFVTGLFLALPLIERDTVLHVNGAVSKPYLDMTIATAAHFGVEISHNDYTEFYIEGGQKYVPTDFAVEGDWSAASILLVAGAIAGEVTLRNLSTLSLQADTAVCSALVAAGATVIIEENSVTVAHRPLTAFDFDATQSPDLFPALVALAAAAEGVSHIRGAHRLEHKESNRAEILQEEYEKLGIEIEVDDDVMSIRGGEIRSAQTDSHDDHRIAMSLAASALRCDGAVEIKGSECVSKSYPAFFEDLKKLMNK